tara:strand:+ start:1974 stop:2177 length:204 start_codon:yes stop_codon:yes gene_type:complete
MKASSGHFAALRGKCKDLDSILSYGNDGIMRSLAHKGNANGKQQFVANVADNVVISANLSFEPAQQS